MKSAEKIGIWEAEFLMCVDDNYSTLHLRLERKDKMEEVEKSAKEQIWNKRNEQNLKRKWMNVIGCGSS